MKLNSVTLWKSKIKKKITFLLYYLKRSSQVRELSYHHVFVTQSDFFPKLFEIQIIYCHNT